MMIPDINRCQHVVARPGCACCATKVRAITRKVNGDLSRRGFMAGTATSVAMLGVAAYAPAKAQTADPARTGGGPLVAWPVIYGVTDFG